MTAELVPDEPAAGHRLAAGYTIDAPISRGAMGSVYRAHGEDGREVAIKRLVDLRQAARFEIEARLLARLRHPRIAHVLDHFQDEDGSYLVMDLVRGADLGEVIGARGGPGLPVEEAVEYATQTCEALQYVHDEQVLHRDVKPRNLILGEDGIVLVDFGVAPSSMRTTPAPVPSALPSSWRPKCWSGSRSRREATCSESLPPCGPC